MCSVATLAIGKPGRHNVDEDPAATWTLLLDFVSHMDVPLVLVVLNSHRQGIKHV